MAGELSDMTTAQRRSARQIEDLPARRAADPLTLLHRRLLSGLPLLPWRSMPFAVCLTGQLRWAGLATRTYMYRGMWPIAKDACLSVQPLAAFATDHSTGNNATVACLRRSAWPWASSDPSRLLRSGLCVDAGLGRLVKVSLR